MSISFEELVARSGDSKLVEYQFSDGILTVQLEMDDLDETVVISVPTDLVSGAKLSSNNEIFRTCRLELIELSSFLNMDKDFYVPNSSFGGMMKEAHCGASLAYGRKISDIKWLLNIIGYSRLLSCLISNLEQVTLQFKD